MYVRQRIISSHLRATLEDMAENDLGIWFRSIPIVTRWWFSLSIVFPLLGKLGLINGYYMILDYHSIVSRFQVRCFNYLQSKKIRKWFEPRSSIP